MALVEEDEEEEGDLNHKQLQLSNAMEASPESSSPQSVGSRKHRTLPIEIIIEFLLKLPVESLLRCKSVCKSWCSLISDPHFVTSHLNLSAHSRLIYTLSYGTILNTCCLNHVMNHSFIDNALEVVDNPLKSACKEVRIIGSCNGLLCLRVSTTGYYKDDILFIWNPSTRKYHKLPSDAYRHNVVRKRYDFGYDDSTKDYKVVSISRKLDDGRVKTLFVKMYSLKNGSWKDIGAFPHGRTCGSGKFSNGALHRVAYKGEHNWKIISLELATETFGEVMQPMYDEGVKFLKLGTLGEWLCVLCHYDEIRVDLWAMKIYGVKESWTKLVSVPYMPDPVIDPFLDPLCISNDGKILLTFGSKLIIYDSKNKSLSDVKNFNKGVHASIFVESLVSPMPPAAAPEHRVAGSVG